jgi:hypothetical protein
MGIECPRTTEVGLHGITGMSELAINRKVAKIEGERGRIMVFSRF